MICVYVFVCIFEGPSESWFSEKPMSWTQTHFWKETRISEGKFPGVHHSWLFLHLPPIQKHPAISAFLSPGSWPTPLRWSYLEVPTPPGKPLGHCGTPDGETWCPGIHASWSWRPSWRWENFLWLDVGKGQIHPRGIVILKWSWWWVSKDMWYIYANVKRYHVEYDFHYYYYYYCLSCCQYYYYSYHYHYYHNYYH